MLIRHEQLAEQGRRVRAERLIPVTLYSRCGMLRGMTERASYTGILVRFAGERLPFPGENCRVRLEMGAESVEALGEVVRVNRHERECAIDFTQLGQNGMLLLLAPPPNLLPF